MDSPLDWLFCYCQDPFSAQPRLIWGLLVVQWTANPTKKTFVGPNMTLPNLTLSHLPSRNLHSHIAKHRHGESL
jgi:hypothetical protein